MANETPVFSEQHSFTDVSAEHAYRGVSRLALTALLLGLISPVALTHPLSWTIPCLGAIVAWRAIRLVSHSNSTVSGSTIAILGLCLSVLFGCWAVVKHTVERNVLESQAREFGETWLNLVREGHLQEAHRWMLPHHARQSGMPTQQFYEENVRLLEDLESEFTSEPANLVASQPDSTIRFQGLDTLHGNQKEQTILLIFELESDGRESVPFVTRVRRLEEGEAVHWQLVDLYETKTSLH